MSSEFFPPRPASRPTIYAYQDSNPQYDGLLKVGYTTRSARERLDDIYNIKTPGPKPYKIVLEESAMRHDGTAFTDHDVHRYLKAAGFKNSAGEWFKCEDSDVRGAIVALREGKEFELGRDWDFKMRPEQAEAVELTAMYFKRWRRQNHGKPPHFLWNAKMRFGKTFAAYQLAKRMGWRRILVLTFKPAVQSAWEEDMQRHVDFAGWQFIRPGGLTFAKADKKKPIVCFGSFQDYLGRNPSTGGIKTKNQWVHDTEWDAVILDEYHFGAWRENAKALFEGETEELGEEIEEDEPKAQRDFAEAAMPITTGGYLYLSGTPFRAIATGEFIEEQIYNWTYSDEQREKRDWTGPGPNPYAALPRMVLMTYQLPDAIREIAMQGESNEFDLNAFFKAEGEGEDARFKFEDEVQKWLDLIRGELRETTVDNLKMGAKKPPLPFSHAPLLSVLTHTLWFLPSVAACHAMARLLRQKQNAFYRDYQVIVAAGPEAGIGPHALPPVLEAIDNPLASKTITLTCGKLTTGVTVRAWTGIFMLRNSSTPETYFQAAFRVQSPWTVMNPDGDAPNREQIIKEECYVFDFAPDRALRQIWEYAARLNVDESDPLKKVEQFISFLPVLAYDGCSMKQLDAANILDMAMSGLSATLLARRWESALLVNVDNATLARLMANKKAMEALMSIEGFRSLNQDIETIINKSEAVEKVRREKNDQELTAREKRELTEAEKEYKTKRKQIQEKLIKFATRIPIFMYLTDYRERCLKDVITQLEPALSKRVTGLSVKDFELLVSLGVFNSALMNDAVYKFKRFENASLMYTGICKHEAEDVGLFDTVLSADDYQATFENLQTKQ